VTRDARRPSKPQNIEALESAQRRRLAFSAIRRQIEAMPADQGRATVANHLRVPNDTVAAMRLDYMLRSIHRVGRAVMLRLLQAAAFRPGGPVRENARIGELTARQRNVIADELTGKASR